MKWMVRVVKDQKISPRRGAAGGGYSPPATREGSGQCSLSIP